MENPERYVKNLATFLDYWDELMVMGAKIKRYAQLVTQICDRSELPDWVIILAEGNPEHMADVIAVAREDMKEENNAEHLDLSKI